MPYSSFYSSYILISIFIIIRYKSWCFYGLFYTWQIVFTPFRWIFIIIINECFSNVNIKHSSILDEKNSRLPWILITSPVNPYHVSRESLKCSQTLVKSRFFNDFIQKFSLYLISEVFWLPVGLTKLHSNLNYYISVRILLDIF